jgi:hypothetical protein
MTDEEWKVQRQQASKRRAVRALHSTGFATNAGNATKSIVELTSLRDALRKQWTNNAEFDRITDRQTKITNDLIPESMLVTLDLEFSNQGRRVFEIGITCQIEQVRSIMMICCHGSLIDCD